MHGPHLFFQVLSLNYYRRDGGETNQRAVTCKEFVTGTLVYLALTLYQGTEFPVNEPNLLKIKELEEQAESLESNAEDSSEVPSGLVPKDEPMRLDLCLLVLDSNLPALQP